MNVTTFNVAADSGHAGTVEVNGDATSGGERLVVGTFHADGVINVNSYATMEVANRSHMARLNVSGTSALALLDTTQDVDNLSVTSAGLAKVTARSSATSGTSKVLRIYSSLTISGGKVDLTNNAMVVANGVVGTATSGTYSDLSGLIQSGRNGGSWNGSGIISSSATSTLYSIGIATAMQAKGVNSTDTTTFSGETVTGHDVLIKFTYGGDATVDGIINVDDYGRIDFNVNLGTDGWFNGDFNYDGKITVDDYGIIDFNDGIQGSPIT